MKNLLVLLLCLIASIALAQDGPDIEKDISILQTQIKTLRAENIRLRSAIEAVRSSAHARMDSMAQLLQTADQSIQQTRQEVGRVDEAGNRRAAELDASMSRKSLYGIIAFLSAALLATLAYFLLTNRLRASKTTLEDRITDTQKTLEAESGKLGDRIAATQKAIQEETVKLDTKLTELLEKQMNVAQDNKPALAPHEEEPDHSLALKVADEIMRINKNLANMDPATKGLKQLAASVKRIEDNFAANGYDMPEFLNKPFDAGMKVIVVNSIPDENLKSDEEIITRIIKPQVNYRGVMIQAAQVEVSVGQ